MNSHVHPVLLPFLEWFAPPPYTEEQLQQADLDYLNNQAQRDARRVREAHQMDLDELRRKGL